MSTDYSNVDWTLHNTEIARILNVDQSTVWAKRKRLGIAPRPKGIGLRPGQKKRGANKIDDLDYEFYMNKDRFGRPKASNPWKRAVIRRCGPQCGLCGYYKEQISNHCHHIQPLNKGGLNTIRNGIVLCSRCHEEVHAGLINLNSTNS